MASNIASLANHSQNSTKHQDVVMVMVPFPAQGHLNQLLHLSRLVSSYHLPVHYVSFSTSIQQAKLRVHGWDPVTDTTHNIHFKEFPLPSTHVQSPNCSNMSKFIASTLDLSLTLRKPISSYLNELSSKTRRLVIIYDSLMAWVVQDIVSIPNVEAYCFRAVSAFTTSSILWEGIEKFFHLPKFLGKFIATKFLKIPQQLPLLESSFTQELLDFIFMQDRHNNICSGNLFDTCKVIEGPFLESLEKLHRLLRRGNQWAIGPFNPIKIQKDSKNCHKCLRWLDKQEPNSVILVSFGTTSSLSSEQIKELAIGLEKSNQKFIWVVRDVLLGEDEEVNIPNGYEERIEGRGIIVKDWAPQFEILGHSSTGGFLSHCGWNSCMESITMGVPIATWPMSFDQPRNAVLVTNVLKIGIVVKDWEHCEDLVSSTTIENVVRKLMVSSEGNEMRKRAMEFGKKVRESMMDGGISKMEMDSFISHVTRY
ncbi:zeatin O-xylosyltransferase-like [Nicotiana sylvestris]|uniref:Glycosyltransferase n=1 Tax=Nicotiana sylvestris TaxID=4096 RepID=A0A1U7WAL3_NICSY|nr:PREDICTED: zeatin O-xylosyltransferase-like [Nicotiana sylvestris]XP_016488916.1 PREDICTED: zeatin O-xylosyltransferase-like [Nicotiana tabacum]